MEALRTHFLVTIDNRTVGNQSPSSSSSSSSTGSPLLEIAERICGGYIIPMVCVFGITCNAFNTIILTRRSMKGSPYTYLLGLAITDIMVLTLSLVESALAKPFGQGVYLWQVYDAYVFYPLANVFSNSSVWITLNMTLERYISVRYPLKAKEVCTRRLARKTIVATVVFALVVNIPRFFCSAVIRNSVGSYERRSTDFESSDFFRRFTWLHIAVLHFIPCLLLMYLNASLIAIVFRANRRRAQLRASPTGHRGGVPAAAAADATAGHAVVVVDAAAGCHSTEQIRLTVTCIAIICLFLVCIVPSAFSNRPVAKALFGRDQTMDEFTEGAFYRLLRVITNLLVYCNLSLNFVLYCVFNHKFLYALRYFGRTCLHRATRRAVASSSASLAGVGCGGGGRFRRLSSTTSGNVSDSVKLPSGAAGAVSPGDCERASGRRWGLGSSIESTRRLVRHHPASVDHPRGYRMEMILRGERLRIQFPLRPFPRFEWNGIEGRRSSVD